MDGNYFYIDGNSLDGRDLFEWTEILLVFLNAFFIIGLQCLASQLQNPFVIVLLLLLHYSQAYN